MKITMGGKKVNTTTLLEERTYENSSFKSIKEGPDVMIGSESLGTIVLGLEINHKGSIQYKEKKMILTDREGSELFHLLDEFAYLADDNGNIDLMDLVEETCCVEIIHNTSKQGHRFANVSRITHTDELEEGVFN